MGSVSARTVITLVIALLLATASQGGRVLAREKTGTPEQLTEFAGLVVDSIVIDNRDIYDTSDPEFASFIFAWANRLHWKTAADVIRREVLVEKGKPFDPRLAEETGRNLRQRLVLYDAWLEVEQTAQDSVLVRVVTIDEWSLAAIVNLTQVDDGRRWQAGLRESNLFGRDLLLDLSYHSEPREGDYFSAVYGDDRLYGKPLKLNLSYNDNPVASIQSLTIGHPFYDMSQNLWYRLRFIEANGRRDIYSDRRRIGQSEYTSDRTELGLAWRTGSYSRKLTAAIDYLYTCSRVQDPRVIGSDSEDSSGVRAALPEDSLYHQLEVGLEYREMDFIKLRRVDGFGYTEDFVLGFAATVAAGRAVSEDRDLYNLFTLGAGYTTYSNSNLMSVCLRGNTWVSEGNTHRSLMSASARVYNRSLPFLTFAFAAGYTRDYRPDGTNPLILGGRHLRGYPDYFRTGDRLMSINTEARVFTGLSLLTIELGAVAFADFGRVWQHDGLGTGNLYGSGGIGLRFSSKNASRAALGRIDLSYSETNGWSVGVSSGQFFGAAIGFTPLTSY